MLLDNDSVCGREVEISAIQHTLAPLNYVQCVAIKH